jgi:hypothetical protein
MTTPLVTVYLCPCCDGEATDPHCPCDRLGIFTQAQMDEWRSVDPSIAAIPLPPPPASLDKPCHDCAFRVDSPEREDTYGTWLKILEGVDAGEKFYCHQGMHETKDGRYVPFARDAAGRPFGHPVCAGWLAARANPRVLAMLARTTKERDVE